MKKEIAKELNEYVEIVAKCYSNTNREMNFNNETFKVKKIMPSSDHTATVYFVKSSGKIGAAFFYYIANGSKKGWRYFFPTDSHITGFRGFEFHKLQAEDENYDKNF